MMQGKKIPLRSFKLILLILIYITVLCSLFVAYQYYQEGHLIYQEYAEYKKFPTSDPETFQRNETGFQWNKDAINKTLPTPSASSSSYINIKSFPYIINEPNKCKDESPFLVFLIETTVNEVENRRAIRTTFGNTKVKNGISIILLFLLGNDSRRVPNSISEESEKYHDIIQKDFQDTYKNLTIKTLMGIEWVSNYCPTAKYVMKTDSDMYVNAEVLLDLLGPDQPQKQNYFTGFVMENSKPHRNSQSKWHMPYSLYPDEFYPTFCSGTGYVFSGDVAPKILRSSFKVNYVYLEDVFVGMCLEREGIKVTNPPRNDLFHNYRVSFDPCVYSRIITSHYINPTELINYWKIAQEHKEQCSNS